MKRHYLIGLFSLFIISNISARRQYQRSFVCPEHYESGHFVPKSIDSYYVEHKNYYDNNSELIAYLAIFASGCGEGIALRVVKNRRLLSVISITTITSAVLWPITGITNEDEYNNYPDVIYDEDQIAPRAVSYVAGLATGYLGASLFELLKNKIKDNK